MMHLIEFQFHKGTIKTSLLYHPPKALISFQFHKGTIKTHEKKTSCSLLLISIP